MTDRPSILLGIPVYNEQNTIRSTGKGRQQAAIHIGPNAGDITVQDNRISGHEEVMRE